MKPRQITDLLKNILDLLVEFYSNLYDDYFISISSITGPGNETIVNSKILQYGKLRVGADIYGSVQATCYEKSSYILARFIQDDRSIDTYPG